MVVVDPWNQERYILFIAKRRGFVRELSSRDMLARLHLHKADGEWGVDTPSGFFHHSDKVAPTLEYTTKRDHGVWSFDATSA